MPQPPWLIRIALPAGSAGPAGPARVQQIASSHLKALPGRPAPSIVEIIQANITEPYNLLITLMQSTQLQELLVILHNV